MRAAGNLSGQVLYKMDAIKFQEVRDQFIIPTSRLFTVPAHGLPAVCADELLRSLGSTQLQLPANLRGRAAAHKGAAGRAGVSSITVNTNTNPARKIFIYFDGLFIIFIFFLPGSYFLQNRNSTSAAEPGFT